MVNYYVRVWGILRGITIQLPPTYITDECRYKFHFVANCITYTTDSPLTKERLIGWVMRERQGTCIEYLVKNPDFDPWYVYKIWNRDTDGDYECVRAAFDVPKEDVPLDLG